MSIQAISWVLSQEIFPSSAKFVLLAFADCCGHGGIAYPSVKHLCRITSLERKTVLQCVRWLEENGYIIDTKKRTGSTMQVRVFKLNGLPSDQFHYVYRLTNKETGEFYIGARSCSKNPDSDKYFGSGKWAKKMAKLKIKLEKEIVATFEDRESTIAHENRSILANIDNPLCRNEIPFRQRVPKTEPLDNGKSPVFVRKESRFVRQRVPKTGHGTIFKEPFLLTSGDKKTTSVDNSGAQPSDVAKIAEYLANLKKVCK